MEGGEKSPNLLEAILEHAMGPVLYFEPVRDETGETVDFRYRIANPAAQRVIQRGPEIVGKRLLEEFPAHVETGLFDAYVQVVKTGEPFRTVLFFPDGLDRWYQIEAVRHAGAVLVTGADITDYKRQEEELFAARRMEAIGRLASGVAHDFNNFLTIISASAASLRRDYPDAARETLEEIDIAVDRAASLTGQLLTFSRQPLLETRSMDLRQVVTELGRLLQRVLGQGIALKIDCPDEPSLIESDRARLEQILMNLVINARDAMPRGGHLSIAVDNLHLDESYVERHTTVEPGDYVLVSVTDTGCGMDDQTQAQVFDPFFTTKGEEGTGLGLSTVYRIMRQLGGHAFVYSELGHGTTFKLYLPRAETPARSAPEIPTAVDLDAAGKTVLVLEDEPSLRRLAARILATGGYRVIEAASAQEALERTGDLPHLDLLLSDIVLPRTSGIECAETLGARFRGLRLLFTSGFADSSTAHRGVMAGAHFLPKPYTPSRLLAKVREALEAPG